ncbi:MAG: hypothetical protein HYZ54_14210 [Ignavibacteriae bacterium]|nr:hypothetical protein [Ignavibacteriota bacterium]
MKFPVNLTLTAALILLLSIVAHQDAYSVLTHKTPTKQNSKIARKLELTDELQNKLKELGSDLLNTTKDLRKSIEGNRKKIQEMIADDSYSTAKGEQILKENAELERKIDVATLSTHEKLSALLSAEQRQKLKAYNSSNTPKPHKDRDDTDDEQANNLFSKDIFVNGLTNHFPFNGLPPSMDGAGALLPRAERELLFPSSPSFSFSFMGDGELAPLQELNNLQFFGNDTDIPSMPRMHPPKPPRPPKMPREPNMDNVPKWDFDVEDVEEDIDDQDSKMDRKIEELEQKLKELEKKLEKKSPKN